MATIAGLDIDDRLYDTVERIAAGTGYDAEAVFKVFAEVITRKRGDSGRTFLQDNRDLLNARDQLQEQLDSYHRENPGRPSGWTASAPTPSLRCSPASR